MGVKSEHAGLIVEAAKKWQYISSIAQEMKGKCNTSLKFTTLIYLLAPKIFASHGLPPPGKQFASCSTVTKNESLLEALFNERTFTPLQDLKLNGGKLIWDAYQQGMMETYRDEAKIWRWVSYVMTDAIYSIGLKNVLDCEDELGIFEARSDIWIFLKKQVEFQWELLR